MFIELINPRRKGENNSTPPANFLGGSCWVAGAQRTLYAPAVGWGSRSRETPNPLVSGADGLSAPKLSSLSETVTVSVTAAHRGVEADY